jgi:hypothetical protein
MGGSVDPAMCRAQRTKTRLQRDLRVSITRPAQPDDIMRDAARA